ncbi:CheA signal transduction histidine kinase [Solidesulfovibrio fructosivorans JJ]]|uniref:Chemotaxis protein CheA n=1 Tax=Solidesulfovibrio fructosivorans JJ] TaxID=596151 RepID=E1JS19_SOLFR|nr:chemotaxis protein CheA [Solidesulfovibrio fructosivorans]EFL52788.1 CheA signal transduction histidine kinase [Solidesulfovibrio fructosivorans JJ]]
MVEDDKILELFAESCLEQLSGIEAAILDLESAGPDALGPKVAAVFRAAHTIKGDAGAVGAANLAELAHAVESVLDAVREGRLPVTRGLIGELLAVFDVIKTMVEAPVAGSRRDVAPEMARMAALLEQHEQPPAQPSQPVEETAPGEAKADERIRKLAIDARELDILVDRVGELGIAQARLAALSARRPDEELRDVAEEVERLAALLRDQVLGLRLLPIKISFPKYRRLVRDTCATLGKDAELVMDGENTELDKAVIEQLNTPCIHLLRNAVDHGIEPPDARQALGKSRRGTIRLAARQDGNDVVIAIADDGAGIDAAKLWRKAVAAGRIPPDRPYDAHAALELIFLPGLSTADRVGAVSGRGVGMDAVREGIDALRGRIEVASTPGAGSVFTIRLPVSLAIIDCLEVRLGAETYYLHLDYVEECLELPPATAMHRGRGVMELRGEPMPLVCLRHFFGLPGPTPETSHVVTLRRDEGRAGLVVDGVVGRKQAVLKHLGRALGKVAGVLGATVTEDGDMALVVDVPGLLHAALAEDKGTGDNAAATGIS